MKTGIHILSKRLGATSILLSLVAATFVGCGKKEEIKTYSVSKKTDSGPMMAALNAKQPDVPVNAAPVSWTTPEGWKQVAPTGIRLGELHISGKDGKQAKAVIFSFPGSVGGELDNWNRWRREVGLAEATEKEMTSEKVLVGEAEAKLYDIPGETGQNIVAALMRDGASWFFKLLGDKQVVSESKPAFIEFLKSVRFDAPKTAAVSKEVDPHAGLNLKSKIPPVAAQAEPEPESPDQPKWNIPSGWEAKAAPPMVLKAFSAGGGKAAVAISKFPGDVGGIFANVNRWRGQLGLPPVTEDQLPKVITTVDVEGGKATFVDFSGKDKTGSPTRMVAAAVPNGDFTWFYKLTGDDSVVGKEKEAFTQFVKTVRY